MGSLFVTKPVDRLIAETQQGERSLRRVLGPVDLIALGIGATIGAGIFATIGTAAAGDASRPGAGPALILSFVLTAVVCAFTGLCYAELASLVPVSGSAYTFAYVTLGEVVAWIIGWDLIIEYAIGNVAVAISWANYCNTLLAGFGLDLPRWLTVDYRTAAQKMPDVIAAAPHVFGIPVVFNLLALGIVAVLSIILVWGVRASSLATTVMVAVKLLVLGLFVLVGARFIKPENWQPFAPNGFAGVAAGAAIVFFAYIGFDAVSTCAEETRRPGRDLPIGILGSLAASTLIYVVVAVVFTGLIPFPALRSMTASDQAEPLTVALKYVGQSNTTIGVVAFGSVIAHTAVLLVFQLGQARIFMAMARDGLLPASLARIHPRFRTPHIATILTGIGVGILAAVSNIDEMVDLTNIGTLFAFVLVCIGVSILRFKAPDHPRPFRVPGGPILIPTLGSFFCLGMIAHLPQTSWKRFDIWMAVGLVLYASYGYAHSQLRRGTRQDRISKVLFSFTGRIGRATFWGVLASILVIGIAVVLVWDMMGGRKTTELFAMLLLLLWGLTSFWIGLAIQAKRWHDRNKSAYMICINLIPVLGGLWTLMELGFFRGTTGANRYGESDRSQLPASFGT